jgi:hypothetical protein
MTEGPLAAILLGYELGSQDLDVRASVAASILSSVRGLEPSDVEC